MMRLKAVLKALWDLEERGITVRLNATGQLIASNASRLSGAEVAWLKSHRDDIRPIVAYVPAEI